MSDETVVKTHFLWDVLLSLPVGVLVFNTRKSLSLANPMARTLTGIYREDATFGDFLSVFSLEQESRSHSPQNSCLIVDAVESVLTEGKLFKCNEFPLRGRVLEVTVAPIKTHDFSTIVGGVVIMHDITRIKEIDALKSEFVTVASHQLRTPLTSLRLYAEMLLSEDVGSLNDKQKEYLEAIMTSTERMIVLVNDLLNISRIEAGKFKIEPHTVDLGEWLKKLVDEVRMRAHAEKCEIIFHDPPRPILSAIDEKVFRQVVLNILSNALKYGNREDCRINIFVYERGAHVIVAIEDNGIGIPEDVKHRVFEKFFRAGNAVARAPEGSGMGMYIAKTLIEASGGRIWFRTTAGAGTTFYILLPKSGMRTRKGEKSIV